MHADTRTHTPAYRCNHAFMHAYMHTFTCKYICFLSTNHITNPCLCIYGIHTCIHTYNIPTCIHICIHTYSVHTYIHVFVVALVRAYACSFVCSFSCLFVVRLSLFLLFVCSVLTDNYTYGSFRKLGVPYFAVLKVGILLFGVLFLGSLYAETRISTLAGYRPRPRALRHRPPSCKELV